MTQPKPAFIDFFAGSGGVTQRVRHACVPVGSNNICPKKAAMDNANHGHGHFQLDSIEQVQGHHIPSGVVL